MRKAFSAKTEADQQELFKIIGDLTTYPHWLDVVSEVEPTDDPEAWLITLKARVGPFSRSKRLRMARVQHHAAVGETSLVRFERREVDGKDHADWTLAAEVDPVNGDGDGGHRSEVRLELSYGGGMWSAPLEGVLGSAADRATEKLQAYVRA